MSSQQPWCDFCTAPALIHTQLCRFCKYDGVDDYMRWYCSFLCQKYDSDKHQDECKALTEAREAIEHAQRSGYIAQVLFYAFIEETWAHDLSQVTLVRDEDNNLLRVETTSSPDSTSGSQEDDTCERYAGGWLYKFPNDVLGESEGDAKHAILASQNSVWAFVFMRTAVEVLFKDLVKDPVMDIKEVVHYVPRGTRPLVQHKGSFGYVEAGRRELPYPDHDASGRVKGVYQITLRTGAKIALDLASAQYAIGHDPVQPWREYTAQWGNDIKYCIPLGSHRDKHIEHMLSYKCITYLTVVLEQTMRFENSLQNFKEVFGAAIQDVQKFNTADFDDQVYHIEVKTKQQLASYPKELDTGHVTGATAPFDIRHPKFRTRSGKTGGSEFQLPQLGPIAEFDWDKLRTFIQMDSKDVGYQEKKMAKDLLQRRCALQKPGDWRTVFLRSELPSNEVPPECVSKNPNWKKK